MKRIEFLIFFLLLLSVTMRYNDIPGSRQIIIFSGILLMFFYLMTGIGITRRTFFLTAVAYQDHTDRPVLYIRALGGVVFSICLYSFYQHEFYQPMRTTGGILAALLLTLLMFLSLLLLEKRDPGMNKSIMLRSAVASAVLMFYTLVPIRARLSWQFDDQYYREILEYTIQNPDDQEARREVEDYERRLEGLSPAEDQGVEETQ